MAETLEIRMVEVGGQGRPQPGQPGYQLPTAPPAPVLQPPQPQPPPVVTPQQGQPQGQPQPPQAPPQPPPPVVTPPRGLFDAEFQARQVLLREAQQRQREEQQRQVRDRLERIDPARRAQREQAEQDQRQQRQQQQQRQEKADELAGLQRMAGATNSPLLANYAQFQASMQQMREAKTPGQQNVAGAGLAGSVLGAAQALDNVQKKIEEGFRQQVESTGQMAVKLARQDTSQFAEIGQSIAKGMGKQLAFFGPAFEESVRQMRLFAAGVSEAAKRLSPYSSSLAQAQAENERRRIEGDIKRAESLGKGLSQLAAAQERADQSFKDIQASVIKPFFEYIGPKAEKLADTVEELKDLVKRLMGQQEEKKEEDIIGQFLEAAQDRWRGAGGREPLPPPRNPGARAPIL